MAFLPVQIDFVQLEYHKLSTGDEVELRSLFPDIISWYSEFGMLRWEADSHEFGPARVYTMSNNIPDYQQGDTNWDVGLAAIFDY